MGLDMYLYEDEYVSEYSNKERYAAVCEALGRTDESISISYTVGYWRKANQIHQWFVQNVQDGVDECQKSYVSKDKLKELYDACKQVVDGATTEEGNVHTGWSVGAEGKTDHYAVGQVLTDEAVQLAEKVLPTASGFFFGGTGYDEWYLQDLKDTMAILEKVRNEDGTFGRPGMSYYYRSSW